MTNYSRWPFGALGIMKYGVIVADPPWKFERWSDTNQKKGAADQYGLMELDEIKALPVGHLAGGDCVLLLWTCGWAIATGQAQEVARAWGFKPITEIVWRKTTVNGCVRMGPGYRARTMHEPILLCTNGNPDLPALPSLFDGVAREHSRKPEEFYVMVQHYTPNLRRCDLFARQQRSGWDVWGNETGKFAEAAE
jgi:N6-adenosine-specific RNA methylase IME4